jgi:hypothetical protein
VFETSSVLQISSFARHMGGGIGACDQNYATIINMTTALPRKACNDSPNGPICKSQRRGQKNQKGR